MKKTVVMFPGQGVQKIGMGKDIYEEFEEARKIYEIASSVLNFDVAKFIFEGEQELLNRTDNAQIAILITSLAMFEVVKNTINPDYFVGLSLGEYTALICSGAISLEEGITLVQKRGAAMQKLVPEGSWQMLAVLGLDTQIIEEVCKAIRDIHGFVMPTNYNYLGQTVITGNNTAVEKAAEIVKEMGAKKTILLNTSGPFHTEKLSEARKEFEKALEQVKFENPKIPVIKNLDGMPYNNSADIKEILSRHIVSPVRFDKAIKFLEENKIENFIEIGAGNTLTGFIKKSLNDANLVNINSSESLKKFLS
jgi:[acyl-carrier-protein] S-malonyltransferase